MRGPAGHHGALHLTPPRTPATTTYMHSILLLADSFACRMRQPHNVPSFPLFVTHSGIPSLGIQELRVHFLPPSTDLTPSSGLQKQPSPTPHSPLPAASENANSAEFACCLPGSSSWVPSPHVLHKHLFPGPLRTEQCFAMHALPACNQCVHPSVWNVGMVGGIWLGAGTPGSRVCVTREALGQLGPRVTGCADPGDSTLVGQSQGWGQRSSGAPGSVLELGSQWLGRIHMLVSLGPAQEPP